MFFVVVGSGSVGGWRVGSLNTGIGGRVSDDEWITEWVGQRAKELRWGRIEGKGRKCVSQINITLRNCPDAANKSRTWSTAARASLRPPHLSTKYA